MIGIDQAEQARDETFLLLAGHDGLAALGFDYATIRPTRADDPSPVDDGENLLVMRWFVPRPSGDGAVRQRVCLSVLGPIARSSALLTRQVLRVAGDALLARQAARLPVTSIQVSTPHLQQSLLGTLVTTGFDVVARSSGWSSTRCRSTEP